MARAPQAAETQPPQRELTFTMPVNKPCFALGYREQPVARGDLRRELLAELLPDLVCGGLTDLYRKLYDEALVNPEFSGDAACLVDGACVIAFTGESETPRAVADMVRAEIAASARDQAPPRQNAPMIAPEMAMPPWRMSSIGHREAYSLGPWRHRRCARRRCRMDRTEDGGRRRRGVGVQAEKSAQSGANAQPSTRPERK